MFCRELLATYTMLSNQQELVFRICIMFNPILRILLSLPSLRENSCWFMVICGDSKRSAHCENKSVFSTQSACAIKLYWLRVAKKAQKVLWRAKKAVTLLPINTNGAAAWLTAHCRCALNQDIWNWMFRQSCAPKLHPTSIPPPSPSNPVHANC